MREVACDNNSNGNNRNKIKLTLIEHLPRTRHFLKLFTYINSLNLRATLGDIHSFPKYLLNSYCIIVEVY